MHSGATSSAQALRAGGLPGSGPAPASAAAAAGGVRLPTGPVQLTARGRTLVVYVFGGSDPEYDESLRFFLHEAVKADDNCTYVIVLQGGEQAAPVGLPPLPPNARYLPHPNECYDIGTVGWVLDTQFTPDQLAQFDYFIWLNPSVRGPFMPAYLRGSMHWTEPLLSKLRGPVKLVGPTISCGSPRKGPAANGIHLQSYVVATDREGLAVLRRTGTVFRCWKEMADVILYGEVGTTEAIMAAGWSIDSLMLRYQGLDWRDPKVRATACNGGRNPLIDRGNDGVGIEALEGVWTKVKGRFLKAGWSAASAAAKYAEWARQADETELRAAQGLSISQERLAAVAANSWNPPALQPWMRPECFDWRFYLTAGPNQDLMQLMSAANPAAAAWQHFSGAGVGEGRPFRFVC